MQTISGVVVHGIGGTWVNAGDEDIEEADQDVLRSQEMAEHQATFIFAASALIALNRCRRRGAGYCIVREGLGGLDVLFSVKEKSEEE